MLLSKLKNILFGIFILNLIACTNAIPSFKTSVTNNLTRSNDIEILNNNQGNPILVSQDNYINALQVKDGISLTGKCKNTADDLLLYVDDQKTDFKEKCNEGSFNFSISSEFLAGLSEGSHTFSIVQIDSNNSRTQSYDYQFIKDSILPDTAIVKLIKQDDNQELTNNSYYEKSEIKLDWTVGANENSSNNKYHLKVFNSQNCSGEVQNYIKDVGSTTYLYEDVSQTDDYYSFKVETEDPSKNYSISNCSTNLKVNHKPIAPNIKVWVSQASDLLVDLNSKLNQAQIKDLDQTVMLDYLSIHESKSNNVKSLVSFVNPDTNSFSRIHVKYALKASFRGKNIFNYKVIDSSGLSSEYGELIINVMTPKTWVGSGLMSNKLNWCGSIIDPFIGCSHNVLSSADLVFDDTCDASVVDCVASMNEEFRISFKNRNLHLAKGFSGEIRINDNISSTIVLNSISINGGILNLSDLDSAYRFEVESDFNLQGGKFIAPPGQLKLEHDVVIKDTVDFMANGGIVNFHCHDYNFDATEGCVIWLPYDVSIISPIEFNNVVISPGNFDGANYASRPILLKGALKVLGDVEFSNQCSGNSSCYSNINFKAIKKYPGESIARVYGYKNLTISDLGGVSGDIDFIFAGNSSRTYMDLTTGSFSFVSNYFLDINLLESNIINFTSGFKKQMVKSGWILDRKFNPDTGVLF